MAHLENTSIGLKMNIEDQDQLQIISRELVPEIKGSMSLSLFNYHKEKLAYLIVLPQEADSFGYTTILLKALGRHGYVTYGDRIQKNGLNYYLTCLSVKEDSQKETLVQNIQKAYDEAEFSVPVAPEIEAVDFKALTLDGQELGNEIFETKAYTIINIWATTCIFCLEILPGLIEWEKELPENVQALYLTAEKEGIASLDRALLDQKIKELGMCPDHVLLYETGFSKVVDIVLSATPTTFLVDSKGKIVGDIVLGSDVEQCRKLLSDLLESKAFS